MILHYSYRCRGRSLITQACAHSHYQRDWRRAHPCDVEQACSRPHAACDGRRSIRPTRPHTTPTTRTGCSPVRGRAPRPRLTRGAPKRRKRNRALGRLVDGRPEAAESARELDQRVCTAHGTAAPRAACADHPARRLRALREAICSQTRLDADDGGMTMPKVARVPRGSECTPEVIVDGLDTNSLSRASY